MAWIEKYLIKLKFRRYRMTLQFPIDCCCCWKIHTWWDSYLQCDRIDKYFVGLWIPSLFGIFAWNRQRAERKRGRKLSDIGRQPGDYVFWTNNWIIFLFSSGIFPLYTLLFAWMERFRGNNDKNQRFQMVEITIEAF